MDTKKTGLFIAVVVAALGYFVDLYDIVIFGVVRVASLNALGLTGADVTEWGIRLLNLQMIGMLVGGVVWGIIGDRFGRRLALFATIATYAAANIANGFVTSVEQYAWLRFVAGFGLAGELGIGVTLVSEALPSDKRGYGTTIIAFLGLVGALTASYVGGYFEWRNAYFVGGGLGLVVLLGRFFGVEESAMFEGKKASDVHQGDLRLLLRPDVLAKFLAVIAVGVPIWYVSALFVNLAPEVGKALALTAPLKVADVLRYQALGLAIGSALTGLLSEYVGGRKFVILCCFFAIAVIGTALVLFKGATPGIYCGAMFFIGLGQGYWTPFITLAAEQFGTNIRATVATSAPNFVRSMTVPVTLAFSALVPVLGGSGALLALGAGVFALAFIALIFLEETYGKDLDYNEPMTRDEARRLLQERRAARAAAR